MIWFVEMSNYPDKYVVNAVVMSHLSPVIKCSVLLWWLSDAAGLLLPVSDWSTTDQTGAESWRAAEIWCFIALSRSDECSVKHTRNRHVVWCFLRLFHGEAPDSVRLCSGFYCRNIVFKTERQLVKKVFVSFRQRQTLNHRAKIRSADGTLLL